MEPDERSVFTGLASSSPVPVQFHKLSDFLPILAQMLVHFSIQPVELTTTVRFSKPWYYQIKATIFFSMGFGPLIILVLYFTVKNDGTSIYHAYIVRCFMLEAT